MSLKSFPIRQFVEMDLVILWTEAFKASLSLKFSRQEYWGGVPSPSPRDLPDPGIVPRPPAWQADS